MDKVRPSRQEVAYLETLLKVKKVGYLVLRQIQVEEVYLETPVLVHLVQVDYSVSLLVVVAYLILRIVLTYSRISHCLTSLQMETISLIKKTTIMMMRMIMHHK